MQEFNFFCEIAPAGFGVTLASARVSADKLVTNRSKPQNRRGTDTNVDALRERGGREGRESRTGGQEDTLPWVTQKWSPADTPGPLSTTRVHPLIPPNPFLKTA